MTFAELYDCNQDWCDATGFNILSYNSKLRDKHKAKWRTLDDQYKSSQIKNFWTGGDGTPNVILASRKKGA